MGGILLGGMEGGRMGDMYGGGPCGPGKGPIAPGGTPNGGGGRGYAGNMRPIIGGTGTPVVLHK